MASINNDASTSKESHLRDQDLVRWLENKLGSNELWGSRHASSMLTREMLIELETCFQELEPPTKRKIIQAIARLSPKTLQAWKEPLLNLIELARRDPDEWVEAMADIFRNFPDLGIIQCSSRPDSFFNKTLDGLMRILTKTFDEDATNVQFPLPPDSALMNALAIEATYGRENVEMNKQKHFTLKKQSTKFDKLLADVKKASEQQNNPANRKCHGGMLASTFPIKIRSSAKKLDNDLPMKGLSSSTSALKMSTGFTNDSKKFQQRTLLKRAGGAQLLDIGELPQPNRRRRQTVSAAPSSSTTAAVAAETGVVDKAAVSKQQRKNSLNKRQMSLNNNNKLVASDVLPSSLNVARQQQQQRHINSIVEGEAAEEAKRATTGTNGDCSYAAAADRDASGGGAFPPANHNIGEQFTDDVAAAATSASFMHQQHAVQHPNPHRQLVNNNNNSTTMISPSSSTSSSAASCFNNLFTEISAQQQLPGMDTNSGIIMENEALKQFNALLKDANKLNPLSYNMIISFLTGNKTNPLVEKLGTIITLPLSETVELESVAGGVDGTTLPGMACSPAAVFLVETFFQMNYCTGEWKRLRKSRLLKSEELGKYAHYLHGTNLLHSMSSDSDGGISAGADAAGTFLSSVSATPTAIMPLANMNCAAGQGQPHTSHHFQHQQQQQQFWPAPHHQQPYNNSSGSGNPSTTSSH